MSTAAVAAIKAAILALTDESTRKKIGWVLVAILSPIIVIIALICSIFSATSQQNVSTVELCFHGGIISSEVTPEYRQYVLEMRESFSTLDSMVDEINAQLEDDNSLDANRVKAIFYVLYFGAQQPDEVGLQSFVDCFVTYTEGIRTVIDTDQEGNEVEVEETYQIPHLIEDLSQVYERIRDAMGVEVTPSHQANADNIYNLIVYGSPGGSSGGWFPGADVPFIGVDGFCSPIGAGWESVVTSEFGYRSDPFTGETRGHTGMDLAVPTGTPIRAALPGTVTVSQYNSSYGYYVMIDHGNGLSTLYGHNSQLLAQVGQTVEAGDIISLSGSTGRSTGPHLHFEVRVNGERTNPRYYLRQEDDKMKKATISVAVEQEKLRAIQFYMGKSGTSLEAELDDFMARLYKKYVPSQTREYIESRESSEEPARPKSGKPARTTEPIQAEEVE